jgi:DNA-binding MarR family transcriptional regulator
MQDAPGQVLWQAANTWLREVNAALRPHGLSYVQCLLLAVLADQEATGEATGMRQVALARGLRADVMMTSQVLRALERRGLVSRAADPADSRARRVRLTERGERALAPALGVLAGAEERYFARLGADRAEFTAALGRLIGVRVRLRVAAR